MKKRFLAILAFLVLIPTMIFATDVAITWEWMIDDPQVTGFRYQLNDENADNWIVVDGETTMAVFQNLEGSKEYSLYLQQTFDGVNWSDSAVSIAYPLFEAEPVVAEEVIEEAPMEAVADEVMEEAPMETVAEEVVEEAPMEAVAEEAMEEAPMEAVAEEVVEESPMEAVTEEVVEEVPMEAVAEEVVEEAPMEEVVEVAMEEAPMEEALIVDNSRYFTSIGINLGGSYDLATVGTYKTLQPVAGLTFGFNNMKTFNDKVGLGLDLDLNVVGYIESGNSYITEALALFQDNTDFSLQILLVPELEFTFGKLGIDLGVLGGMTLVDLPYVGQAQISPSISQFKYGVFTYGAKLGLDYQINDLIAFGVDATATKINSLSITDFDYSVDGTMSFKFTF